MNAAAIINATQCHSWLHDTATQFDVFILTFGNASATRHAVWTNCTAQPIGVAFSATAEPGVCYDVTSLLGVRLDQRCAGGNGTLELPVTDEPLYLQSSSAPPRVA